MTVTEPVTSYALNYSSDYMKIVRNILIIALVLLVQSTLTSRFAIFGIQPDMVLILLFLLVYVSGPAESIAYGFLIGFLQDVYTPEYLGANAFSMSLVAFLLDISRDRFTIENYPVRTLVGFLACIIHDIVYLSFYTKFDSGMMADLFIRESLPGAVYTSALLLTLIAAWDWLTKGGLEYVLQGLLGARR